MSQSGLSSGLKSGHVHSTNVGSVSSHDSQIYLINLHSLCYKSKENVIVHLVAENTGHRVRQLDMLFIISGVQ